MAQAGSDVRADLSAYLDGELGSARVAQIEVHISECRVCAAFGAEFGRVVAAIRTRLRAPESLSDAVAGRLQATLQRATK